MPTSADAPFRVSQYAPARSYKAAFVSRLRQREVGRSPDETPSFWRSGAMIIGPGYYDPSPPDQWRRFDDHRQNVSFASTWTRPERTARVDVHGRVLEDMHNAPRTTASMHDSKLQFARQATSPFATRESGVTHGLTSPRSSAALASRAPGHTISKASRWGVTARRDDGLANYNDSSHNTLTHSLVHRDNLRRYAASFTLRPGAPPAPPLQLQPSSSTPAIVGPGAYNIPPEAACGGISRARAETFRPHAIFAPHSGGKWMGTGGTWNGSW